MDEPDQEPEERVEYLHGARYLLTPGVTAADIEELLQRPGEVLKQSPKAQVRLVGDWVVKETNGLLKHTLRRERHRRAWRAAMHLRRNDVGVASPLAFVERGRAGVVSGTAMVSEYLDSYRNVEEFLLALIQRGAGQDTISSFLMSLAAGVNRLVGSGAYHSDLSGKNIFTLAGGTFVFIDLDAVELGVTYDDERRLKNHIQLYDSFCDCLSDVLLVPFIERMLTSDQDPRVWMPKVRKGQQARRLKLEERRAREQARQVRE